MPKVGSIELKIARVEGFRVVIRYPSGADVRADREGMPSWAYERAAKDNATVAQWKSQRFFSIYPGFEVDVLDGDGDVVTAGQTLLETVRDSYD